MNFRMIGKSAWWFRLIYAKNGSQFLVELSDHLHWKIDLTWWYNSYIKSSWESNSIRKRANNFEMIQGEKSDLKKHRNCLIVYLSKINILNVHTNGVQRVGFRGNCIRYFTKKEKISMANTIILLRFGKQPK